MREQFQERQVLVHFFAEMAPSELSVTRLRLLPLIVLAIDDAELVDDLDDHRRSVTEENELLLPGDLLRSSM